MPGKHVRFAFDDSYFPVSAIHSPSGSTSTSSSSATRRHVPRRSHTLSAVPTVSRVNRLLEYSDTPVLSYDLSLPTSTLRTNLINLSSAALSEPATQPSQAQLTVSCAHLPWVFTLKASNGRYVTVMDVLNGLHTSLRANITTAEWNLLDNDRSMRAVSDAYVRRYSRLAGHRGYAEEKAGGVKRIDFLMGTNQFRGLVMAKDGRRWILDVGR
ncbi:unnamed protein product [Mycena citricolor]|uniref:DUF6699 domain-containing protein n=1 Tax=Mycena citricolor TaxID=2018698 RepID=A0AAD2H3Z6_9AGAR|nr:unnamed protein product [Mycena citricolor]